MITYIYGYPRLGSKREYKFLIEKFWKKVISQKELIDELSSLEEKNRNECTKFIDKVVEGEMTFYSEILDTAILFGILNPKNLEEYYEFCRGKNALEMKKWFNTNYHYLVVDFNKLDKFELKNNLDNIALIFKKKAKFPSFIGPYTFLKLSKGLDINSFKKYLFDMIEILNGIISKYDEVHIEEPAFVFEVSQDEVKLIKEAYSKLDKGRKVYLVSYYDSVDFIDVLYDLPFYGLGFDFIRGEENLEFILKNKFPKDKVLIAGVVDGRNIWKTNLKNVLEILIKLKNITENIFISNAAPLYHLPISIFYEEGIPQDIKRCICFAKERLEELKNIKKLTLKEDIFDDNCDLEKIIDKYKNEEVKNRVKNLSPNDFIKQVSYRDRREIQKNILNLPIFPTTTIGSFPQSEEVRSKRNEYINGKISYDDYEKFIFNQIDKLIEYQESLGLDVLVHGEFERTDMVEFFAFKMNGFLTTKNGWVLSYGTRVYRPPIIYADVSRKGPMTINEITYAQSKTKKPVKGMLTGPVTILAWSFNREDIPIYEVAYQIALALKEEIEDYEKNGIKIVQVDEPAFREKAPIKKRKWDEYFEWAIKAFNLATNTKPETQIHTHMCYSEFSEIIKYINLLDFDVITIESSRSKGEIINAFKNINFEKQIGIGVWDIHSPSNIDKKEVFQIVERVLNVVPYTNIWLNPDCGLKTRRWEEINQPLQTIIEVANVLRKKFKDT
ncbi:MAG: 5-methyltetrahydropteroyltriglutamate--homocysteine S-methyltransferase [Endomicrobia bacterium]|nr:5-methyltetrahydropteroyltriglutamate--homocysteine S-methyltransferase [Endomicrobiia bacterium]MDW8056357.1 5-methyltetrahydropteroyltriglutamate--homocysteine S-methyltransferase [Elusimicrobiota bacterium]